jgi:hypothetical protein
MKPRPELKIVMKADSGEFAEDKDLAASLRERQIRPALKAGQQVVLDFTGVRVATQSFIHALVSDILRSEGEPILDRIVFKGCGKAVKGIVETVVQYSLESIEAENGAKPDKNDVVVKAKPRGPKGK